jgi:uncharacterized protein
MANTQFFPLEHYATKKTEYSLLPFRFDRWEEGRYLLINEVGEYELLPSADFNLFVNHQLSPSSAYYTKLKAKHFLTDNSSSALFDQLASKYRTKKSFLDGFTKLHIFVTTLRCNQSCPYCQVSRQNEDAGSFDMAEDAMYRSVDLMLRSPARAVTMEFQGGEPLLNFELLQKAVLYAKEKNATIGKNIHYVICTNLAPLEDKHLDFCKEHEILISTSLDGPDFLHNKNRPMGRGPSHDVVTRNIWRAKEALGKHSVSALMTTTRASLKYPREIVDEYLRMDMGSIFFRDLNPYGFAVKTNSVLGYPTSQFIDFYKEALAYIIDVNRSGRTFSESLTSMILTKILTPWPIGFVDMQSPSGAGIGVVVYNYDGDVYASDESRMLAEMGQHVFRMGNVIENDYSEIFFGETMQNIASASCNESLAGCSDCAYQPYCGADPVRHYSTQGDISGSRPNSEYCKKHMGAIKHVFDLLLNADDDLERILWAWVNREDVNRMRLPEPQWLSS